MSVDWGDLLFVASMVIVVAIVWRRSTGSHQTLSTVLLIAFILCAIVIVAGAFQPAQAADCNPFTTDPQPGMLPIGTGVQFTNYTATGPQTELGTITAYYVEACWPGVPVFGLDPTAYVVDYHSPDGSQTVLNRGRFEPI